MKDSLCREERFMKLSYFLAAALFAANAFPAMAQEVSAPGIGEVAVTANRQSALYAKQDRPVVGLRRQGDSAFTPVSFTSDSRDAETRKKEIHSMLLAAIDRASAAGIELVTGSFALEQVTKANYQKLELVYAGRVDTSKVDLMLKVKLNGSASAAVQQLNAFIKSTPGLGRGTLDTVGGLTPTIINPDQYRDAIIKLVAEDARANAAVFGPDYAVQVAGIDGQVAWSQVSSTEVFLYIPYHYNIVPK
jgi:hypothetical protein